MQFARTIVHKTMGPKSDSLSTWYEVVLGSGDSQVFIQNTLFKSSASKLTKAINKAFKEFKNE